MTQTQGFVRRNVNGTHSSICLYCFRTAAESLALIDLIGSEMVHACDPFDIIRQPPARPVHTIESAKELRACEPSIG
jgi:hypothetical protein